MIDPVALLRTLARSPRPAGGAAESEARRVVRASLESLGFVATERSFTYSAWPGVWGVPAVGALLVAAGVILALGSSLGHTATALTGATTLIVVASAGGALLQRYGTTRLPLMRRAGLNLEAVRGRAAPRVWLVAHLDSKSQPVPMLLRIAAVVTTTAAWLGIASVWIATGGHPGALAAILPALGALAALCAVPIALCTTGTSSDGALDNASGVATLIATAATLPPDLPVGVLITSAEELGLAGARAWVGGAGRIPAPVINFDGVDDAGRTVCMVSHDPGARLRRAARSAARSAGAEVAIRGLVPGVLVDAVAFKHAGWPALTISRGAWGTFARIHTRQDDLGHVRGSGLGPAARFASALVGAIVTTNSGRGDAATGAPNGPWSTN